MGKSSGNSNKLRMIDLDEDISSHYPEKNANITNAQAIYLTMIKKNHVINKLNQLYRTTRTINLRKRLKNCVEIVWKLFEKE